MVDHEGNELKSVSSQTSKGLLQIKLCASRMLIKFSCAAEYLDPLNKTIFPNFLTALLRMTNDSNQF